MKYSLVTILFVSLLITGCGTTSGLKAPAGTNSKADRAELNLQGYTHVTIRDFKDGTAREDMPDYAGREFANIIAGAIVDEGTFEEVHADEDGAEGILVTGKITRYSEGNAALRALIGFGAGSSYFDAIVTFHDIKTNEELGQMKVDKNSWVLGGGLAAGQNPRKFMEEAANKIAAELDKAVNPDRVDSAQNNSIDLEEDEDY